MWYFNGMKRLRQKHQSLILGLAAVLLVCVHRPNVADARPTRQELPLAIVRAAEELLEKSFISYAYGGATFGGEDDCNACNRCLGESPAKAKEQLSHCPVCQLCSIDCSHFVTSVFERAGAPLAFLPTATMVNLSADDLKTRFGLITQPYNMSDVEPGDLVVFSGHVVIVAKYFGRGRADVIHATSGKDLKGPGLGIQRDRFIELDHFRGPVRRILRHIEATHWGHSL